MALREAVALAAVALPFGIGTAVVGEEPPRPLVRFADPEIVESSGLVARDGLLVTVNDSGDEARVFAVDPASGRTVGVGRWEGSPVDVEALAPGPPGEVWVGDIGDNAGARSSVRLTRVAVGRGDRTSRGQSRDLVYPDGPRDAEALLTHPRNGRLYIVSKEVLGGRFYAAPAESAPGRSQQLRSLGEVMPLVTDGAFFPDGRHLVLRDYSRAVVLSFPALEVVGELALPPTEQGEGIAVAPDGTILTSSEGRRAPVHEVALPPDLARAVAGEPPGTPRPGPGRSSGAPPEDRQAQPEQQPARREPWPWLIGGAVGAVMIVVLLRSLRPR